MTANSVSRRKSKSKKVTSRKKRKHEDLTGRRVLVDAAYFGNADDDPYPGLVHSWTSYVSESLQKLWGYDIRYDAGDSYYMLEEDVMTYLVPISKSTIGMCQCMDHYD